MENLLEMLNPNTRLLKPEIMRRHNALVVENKTLIEQMANRSRAIDDHKAVIAAMKKDYDEQTAILNDLTIKCAGLEQECAALLREQSKDSVYMVESDELFRQRVADARRSSRTWFFVSIALSAFALIMVLIL
jgi:uncharacterized protein YeeX (DUF496 family)